MPRETVQQASSDRVRFGSDQHALHVTPPALRQRYRGA
jgi:hypothetical protein